MKKIIITITILASSITLFSQTQTRDDFLGVWEWHNNNQTFRVNFFNGITYAGSTTIRGHFTMVETDLNGNENVLYTSDRPMDIIPPQNWMPMINGGRYCDWIDSFRFSLMDNTTNYLLLGVLDLKFINVPLGSPLQISWKLRVDGMSNIDEVFNVPTDIILIKQ